MTYTVSSGTLNSTIPYYTIPRLRQLQDCRQKYCNKKLRWGRRTRATRSQVSQVTKHVQFDMLGMVSYKFSTVTLS